MKFRQWNLWMSASVVVMLGFSACGNKNAETEATPATEYDMNQVETDDTEDPNSPFSTDSLIAKTKKSYEATCPPRTIPGDTTSKTFQTTPSGLQYLVREPGDGKSPIETDHVTVHYTGRLLDGTVFDSSVSRGQPAEFPLNQVIAGWTEGLQLMKEGGDYVFIIPPELGYGARGAGNDIPPNATLVFEVKLLKVN